MALLDVVLATAIIASGAFENGGDAGAYVDVGLGPPLPSHGRRRNLREGEPGERGGEERQGGRHRDRPARKLFLAGIAVQVINFDAIAIFGGALKEIAEADITTGEEVFATLFGLAIMLSVYYAPVSSTCSDPNGQFRSSVA